AGAPRPAGERTSLEGVVGVAKLDDVGDDRRVAADYAQRIPWRIDAAELRAVVEHDVVLARRERDFLALFAARHERKLHHGGFGGRRERGTELQTAAPKIAGTATQYQYVERGTREPEAAEQGLPAL